MQHGSSYSQRDPDFPSLCSGEDWNQMQSQEEDVAITEQDLELIKERETAIRQLEVTNQSCTVNRTGDKSTGAGLINGMG